MEYLVEMKNISKSFGRVEALKGVNFNVGTNEVAALVGDNGAGKSTLIKILTGVYPPDKGEMLVRGKRIEKYSVKEARNLGVETVYQERALTELQPLWRNIFMGRERVGHLGFLSLKMMKEETDTLMKQLLRFTSEAITHDSIIANLSGGEKQGVAMARALFFEADLIVLDEPTTGLSLTEAKRVLDYVSEIRKKGKACIFITHNIYHVYPVADRFVILDRGRNAGEFRKGISLQRLLKELLNIAERGKTN